MPSADTTYAGAAFDALERAPLEAKALRHGSLTVAVDSVEVFASPVARLAVPRALGSAWGGALVCFVECAGELWPVVSLSRLARAAVVPA